MEYTVLASHSCFCSFLTSHPYILSKYLQNVFSKMFLVCMKHTSISCTLPRRGAARYHDVIVSSVTPIDLPRARKRQALRMRESQLLRCSIAEGQLSSTASSTCWHCQVLLYFLVLVGIQVKGRACAPESKWTDSLTESFSFSGQTM